MQQTTLTVAVLGLLMLTGCNGLFYQPSDKIFFSPEEQNIAYEEITFKTSDGEDLSAWLLNPPTNTPKGTIVHFHGNAENMTSHFLFSSWLVSHGYEVLIFDYRGYGQSSGSPSRRGLVEDSRAVLEGVCRNIKGQRQRPVFVFAQSLGGAVAIPALAATNTAGCIRGLVLDSTFGSYRKIAQRKLASFWLTWPLQIPLSYLISDELSPQDFVDQLQLETIMVHSQNDPVVPYQSGVELYNRYKFPQKQLWTLEQHAHTFAFAWENGPYRQRLVEWLDMVGESTPPPL